MTKAKCGGLSTTQRTMRLSAASVEMTVLGTRLGFGAGVGGCDDVVEDLVDDVLLEDAEVAIGEEVLLEGLQIHALFAGHVTDGEAAEVGEAGLGADGGELGGVDEDLAGLELIGPGLDGGEFGVEAGCGVIVGVAGGVRGGCGAHGSILLVLGGK